MGFHGFDNTEIALELCLNSISSMAKNTTTKEPNPSTNDHHLRPSLTLSSSSDLCRRGSGSFFSNASVKRERDVASEESERIMENNTSGHEDGDHDEGDGGANNRKKLRLTKAQSGLLEEAFKLQPTLNPQKQKQKLARDLNLRPRQVEVWFQNRRARTKLKQTEIDCEYLKRCFKTLTDENQKLRQEVQRLRAQKVSHPLYMQLPVATLTMCPSCEQIGDSHTNSATTKTSFTKPYFFNTFTSSSAAC